MDEEILKELVIEGLITGEKMPIPPKDYSKAYKLIIKSLFLMDKNPSDRNEKEMVNVLYDALSYVVKQDPENPTASILQASFQSEKAEKSLVWAYRQSTVVWSEKMDALINFCVSIPEFRFMMAKGLMDENKRYPWYEERPVTFVTIKNDTTRKIRHILKIGNYRGQ